MPIIKGNVWDGFKYVPVEFEISDEEYKRVFGESVTKHLSIELPDEVHEWITTCGDNAVIIEVCSRCGVERTQARADSDD